MTKKDQIKQRLEDQLTPSFLEVLDESHRHAGHREAPHGGESHFRVRIITKQFDGLKPIDRHRFIYKALKGIDYHAIAIEATGI